jgi:hypothetical protein
MESRNVSWVNWSLCTKSETASALVSDSDPSDRIGTWDDSTDLSASGNYIKNKIQTSTGATPPPESTEAPTPTPEETPAPTDEPTPTPEETPALTDEPTPTPEETSAPTVAPTDPPTGGCDNIFTDNTGSFNTEDAFCFKTQDNIAGWGVSNFDGRTISVTVNGTGTAVTTVGASLPSKGADDYYVFECSAGSFAWAAIYWWP